MTSDSTFVDQAANGFARLSAFLREEQWRLAEAHGLTPTQIDILVLLKRRGACRGRDIARQLGVRQPTSSGAVDALARKGLAGKRRDPSDGRAVLVDLTASGATLAARLDRAPEALETALSRLGTAARADLARSLTTVIKDLQENGAIEPQRHCVSCRFFRPNLHDNPEKPHHCAFVDAAFGDASLRFDCGDHDEADAGEIAENWRRFDTAASA